MNEVMNTNLYDLKEAQNHPLWAQELYNPDDHTPETEEYGVTSFVYRARDPFDPEKIHSFFNQEWPGVIRAKGFFWISSRPNFVGEVSQAGAFVRHQGIGKWWAAVNEEQWPDDKSFRLNINKIWAKGYGDRRQEIVFIGLKNEMNESLIKNKLDGFLIKNYSINLANTLRYKDPFPEWFNNKE